MRVEAGALARAFSVVLVFASAALAQTGPPAAAPSAPRSSVTLSGLWSVQPSTYDGRPYLEGAIGGNVAGAGLSVWIPGSVVFEDASSALITSVEISATRALSGTLAGRLIINDPAPAGHRDILVSFLPGVRRAIGNTSVDIVGGASLVIEDSSVGVQDIPGVPTTFALTAGIDPVIPVSRRIALVPAIRYSFIFRGDRNIYLGLGSHILRAGVGLRVWTR